VETVLCLIEREYDPVSPSWRNAYIYDLSRKPKAVAARFRALAQEAS
jgi:hypothetical protein